MFCSSCFAEGLVLSKKIYNNEEMAFIAHSSNGNLGSYIAMSVNFEPLKELNRLVKEASLQASKFEVICLGMGKNTSKSYERSLSDSY